MRIPKKVFLWHLRDICLSWSVGKSTFQPYLRGFSNCSLFPSPVFNDTFRFCQILFRLKRNFSDIIFFLKANHCSFLAAIYLQPPSPFYTPSRHPSHSHVNGRGNFQPLVSFIFYYLLPECEVSGLHAAKPPHPPPPVGTQEMICCWYCGLLPPGRVV